MSWRWSYLMRWRRDSSWLRSSYGIFFFFQAEDGIRDIGVTGVQTCALPICERMMTLAGELRPYPSIYWAGYVQDAMKEAAEAAIALAVVANRPLPEPAELGVEDAAYLNALAEAASELRRQVLDRLRENDLPRAEYLLGTMDDIYAALVTVDFPDAITGGLRRTTDALRAVLERTRGDVTMAATQGRVERALREALGSEIGLGSISTGDDDAAEPAPMG